MPQPNVLQEDLIRLIPILLLLMPEELKKQSRSGIAVIGKSKEIVGLNDTWKNLLFKSKDASFPLVVVDDKVTWYGFPISELFFEDKNYRFL